MVSVLSAALADTRRWSLKSDPGDRSVVSSDFLGSGRLETSHHPVDEHPDFASPYSQSRFDDDPLEPTRFGAFESTAAVVEAVASHLTASAPLELQPDVSADTRSLSQSQVSGGRKSLSTHVPPPSLKSQHGSNARLSGDDISVPEVQSVRETASNMASALPEEPEPPTSLIDSYIHRLAAIVSGYQQSEKIVWSGCP